MEIWWKSPRQSLMRVAGERTRSNAILRRVAETLWRQTSQPRPSSQDLSVSGNTVQVYTGESK
jgi:hypothetical protein